MATKVGIKEITNVWARHTYNEQLASTKMTERVRKRLRRVLKQLGILEQKILGYSVTGLKKTAEGSLGSGITYSKAFELSYQENPRKLVMLYLKCLALNFEGAGQEKFEGIIARGLRTMPSLMRDRDFAEKLEEKLGSISPDIAFTVSLNPDIDTKKHTDILLMFNKENFSLLDRSGN